MLKIAICDDEKAFAEEIEQLVAKYFSTRNVGYQIDIFESGVLFVELGFDMTQYQIVFFDINMEGMNGMESAKQFRRYCPDTFLIFVTSLTNYALEGYKVEAIRYLIKNHETLADDIKEALDAIFERMHVGSKSLIYDFIEAPLKLVHLCKIMYVENNLHKVAFHLLEDGDEKVYTIYKKLDNVESDFKSEALVRVHQSYLVNMQYACSVERYFTRLKNGKELPVSKQRYRKTLDAYMKQKETVKRE